MPAEQPFVDRPPGDVEAATRFARGVACDHGLAPPVLLNLGMNAIFRCAETVLRVAHVNGPAHGAYDLADALTSAGVRVALPAGGRLVEQDAESGLVATAWEYVEPAGEDPDWVAIGAMVRRVRDMAAGDVPAEHPVPLCTSYPWWRFDDLLADVALEIDDRALERIRRAVEDNRGWVADSGDPDTWVLCHGDVHPNNVIAGRGGPVIIDWDLFCVGPPGWDHAPMRSMVERWGARPGWYADFARGYGADLSTEPVTRSLTTLRLVAATLMRVRAGRTDPAAREEAARRLRYWRGDPGAPVWVMS